MCVDCSSLFIIQWQIFVSLWLKSNCIRRVQIVHNDPTEVNHNSLRTMSERLDALQRAWALDVPDLTVLDAEVRALSECLQFPYFSHLVLTTDYDSVFDDVTSLSLIIDVLDVEIESLDDVPEEGEIVGPRYFGAGR